MDLDGGLGMCTVAALKMKSLFSACSTIFKYFYWAIQRSWFARVNALCNLSRKKSQHTSGLISEEALLHAVYNSGS